jgi:alanine-synthesizing transaminase
MMRTFDKASKLNSVSYDIRGPVHKEARRIEAEGFKVLKLNIGSPGAFGFEAPEEIRQSMITNLTSAVGYGESSGLLAAREAIKRDCHEKGIASVEASDIFIGNGVSELIMICMQGLLNPGDEVLVPMPDYPLWTAAITLSGGKAVHYLCDEKADWNPCIDDIKAKVSPKTKAIVVINPNNPTGAVYNQETLSGIADIARGHELIVYSDEIYSRITYDEAKHIPFASIAPDVLTVTFDGLSKSWRVAGFRTGWMFFTGNKNAAEGYYSGIETLVSMRLCANMPSQFGVQAALEHPESIKKLTLPGGRLKEQRDTIVNMVNKIPGLSVVVPKGALYCFPKIDTMHYNIKSDEKFVTDLLRAEHLLLVHGSGFNWKEPDHFRIVFLPDTETLAEAMRRLEKFLKSYKQGEN